MPEANGRHLHLLNQASTARGYTAVLKVCKHCGVATQPCQMPGNPPATLTEPCCRNEHPSTTTRALRHEVHNPSSPARDKTGQGRTLNTLVIIFLQGDLLDQPLQHLVVEEQRAWHLRPWVNLWGLIDVVVVGCRVQIHAGQLPQGPNTLTL